jgi:cell division initiation protein
MRPKMSPLEIQKREFSRKWKGLDPAEVQTFLVDVAEDMEDLARENANLETRLRSLEQENDEHRERERILKQTLLSAQQASEDIRAAARKEAELVVREAQDSSERLTHSALQRSAEIEKAIHELKIQRNNFRLQLQSMIELFQQVLDFDRDETEKDRPLSYLTRKAKPSPVIPRREAPRDPGLGRTLQLGSARP